MEKSGVDAIRRRRICFPDGDANVTLKTEEVQEENSGSDQLKRKPSHRQVPVDEEQTMVNGPNYAPSASRQFSLSSPPPNLNDTLLLQQENRAADANEDVVSSYS